MFKNALCMSLRTIFRPKIHYIAVFRIYNLKFFPGVYPRNSESTPGAWTETPISACLVRIPIVPGLRNDHWLLLGGADIWPVYQVLLPSKTHGHESSTPEFRIEAAARSWTLDPLMLNPTFQSPPPFSDCHSALGFKSRLKIFVFTNCYYSA